MTQITGASPLAKNAAPREDAPVYLGRAGGNWFQRTGWRHLVAIVGVFFAVFPILFLVSAALNPLGTLSASTLIPTGASFNNFSRLFNETDYWLWLRNSLIIGVVSTVASIFVSTCAAYAFSRFRFKGRRAGLLAVLLIQMFPVFLALVSLYLIFATITDLYPVIGFNTPWALVLLGLGGALGGTTWLIKGFLDTVPKDLDESATVDGATHVQIFFGIIFPLITPIIAITGLLAFIGSISEFLIASVFLTEPTQKTVAVGLYGMVANERNANFGMFAAGAVITAIPIVLLFQYLQKYIVSGLTAGAVKG
ncbi:sugar ABC transporter permease [Nakamurella antarctica]|uniref:Sugar ABC transporter permease n=1 Tax=Nakamurella antarctica TaxID=1902245 RepID=A0A3G8ZHP3_9ACTN|nr:sugar ABC transporter permease [Nakamurella antarctica]AZI56869.1 sugar ABC transporter permease [Nakamurella antarctica]